MRRKPSRSARAVALATVFCALGIASGCGREQFDLLSDESLVNAGRTATAGALNRSGSAGFAGSAGASGKSSVGGAAGKMGGFGGRLIPPGGGSGNAPCFGEGGCPDEPLQPCEESDPLCKNCIANFQCGTSDTPTCALDLGRCVRCRSSAECPGALGEYKCNPKTYRCEKTCTTPGKECGGDAQRFTCSERGVCVSCVNNTDCNAYGPFSLYCYQGGCFECLQDKDCVGDQRCVHGQCWH